MSLKTAILQLGYDNELKNLGEIIRGKAKYLAHIDSREYFLGPYYDPVRTPKQIARLSKELNFLIGFQMLTTSLKASHEADLESMSDAYEQQIAEIRQETGRAISKLQRELNQCTGYTGSHSHRTGYDYQQMGRSV